MSGERSAAHTHDTGVLHHLDQFFGSDLIGFLHRVDIRTYGIIEIIFNDYAHHRDAAEMDPGFHRHYLAGYAGMYRSGNESHGSPTRCPTVTVSPTATQGLQGAPICIDIGITTRAGGGSFSIGFLLVAAFLSLG